ncbi:DUF2924 domain-containing protein [Sphingobium xenophagum]|uniref:DUF2924 domain-containing protein n=1 Tax=Sphingobium xenophagum TaxID=121428 RepID=UPI000365CC5A|nr:DUF2924 domain-containing protein [Sphingobium xenophagum]
MDVEQEVARLESLSLAELRTQWARITNSAVPKVSARMLRLAVAWELQARAYGGLSRETIRKLDQIGRGLTQTSPARPGMRLAREWNGRLHVVTVGEDKVIRWEEREYRSLSEVARAITGTRWSGPAFFGLKKKAA